MHPRTDLRTTGASDRRASARFCCPPSAAPDEDAPVAGGDKEDTEEEAAEVEDDGHTDEVDVLAADDDTEAARALSRCALTERLKVPDPGSTPSGSEAAISFPYFFFGAIVWA